MNSNTMNALQKGSVMFITLAILVLPFAAANAADYSDSYTADSSWSDDSSYTSDSSWSDDSSYTSDSSWSDDSGYTVDSSWSDSNDEYTADSSWFEYTDYTVDSSWTTVDYGCTYDCGGDDCTYDCGGCTYNCNPPTCKYNCEPPHKPAPKCELYISPSHVDYGDDAEIHWSTTNASSVYLTSFGSVSKNGSEDIYNIKSNKTYTLTAAGNGKTVTCKATIKVEKEKEDLECKLKVSDDSIRKGDKVKLTWSSDGAEYGRITPEIGKVDEDGYEYVYPREDTTYKGTFYNDDGDKVTCRVEVEVDKKYIPPHYPQTPYVTLSAVPYTGLDLGPVGTFLYWSFLVLWSLFAAYLIAVKRAHMSFYRWYKKALFGEEVAAPVEQPAFAGFAQADLAALAVALRSVVEGTKVTRSEVAVEEKQENDAVDPFVLSQINRTRRN